MIIDYKIHSRLVKLILPNVLARQRPTKDRSQFIVGDLLYINWK